MSDRTTGDLEVQCRLCGTAGGSVVADVRQRPACENDFGINPQRYRRHIYQCGLCEVYFNVHDLLDEALYTGNYNQSVYQRDLATKYEQIMNLPREASDNKQRVQRIAQLLEPAGRPFEETRVLDVGSGLCVFLAQMKTLGFRGFCIDPDPIAVRHAREVAGVEGAHAGTLIDYPPDHPFDLITFNKVLEHVKDPIVQLARAAELLAADGCIYVELPDGDGALENGNAIDREEFFIEHHTVFNLPSVRYLVEAAGLSCPVLEAIHEPSDKYTIYALCRRR